MAPNEFKFEVSVPGSNPDQENDLINTIIQNAFEVQKQPGGSAKIAETQPVKVKSVTITIKEK